MEIHADQADSDIVDEPASKFVIDFTHLWRSMCRGDEIPARSDFPMDVLIPWLGHILIMDVVDQARDFRYRLVGTELVKTSGRDLTGKLISECDYDCDVQSVVSSFRKPVETRQPVFRRGPAVWQSRIDFLTYESVHCPLRGNSDDIAMTIGVQHFFKTESS